MDSNLNLNSNSFVLFELVCFSKKEKERKIREKERSPANQKPQLGPAQTALENPTQIPQAGPFLSLKPSPAGLSPLFPFLPSRPSSRERKVQHPAACFHPQPSKRRPNSSSVQCDPPPPFPLARPTPAQPAHRAPLSARPLGPLACAVLRPTPWAR